MENIKNIIRVISSVAIVLSIRGFTFAKLWLWFIVPIFQIRPLNIIEALGIMVLIKFSHGTIGSGNEKNTSWKSIGDGMDLEVLWAAVALLFGWLLSLLL
ncbi:MAG: hypothetical protein KBG80_09360 [Breznakibacter sp.]|nr:hypothetical protein [Breznakibacter sp.]